MAKLNFNIALYLFKGGLDPLMHSFDMALNAIEDEIERKKDDAAGYQQELAQGGESIGEWDGEGFVIWDLATNLEIAIEQAEAAKSALCKAFAMTIYHQWERSIIHWVKATEKLNHIQLIEKAKAKGMVPHSGLDALRDLANTLKHNSNKYGEALTSSWPELFPNGFSHLGNGTDWYGAIRMRPADVTIAFEIVLASGPPS